MKGLFIVAVILTVFTLYFIVSAKNSIIIKGNEVVPAGTDLAKLIFEKAKKVPDIFQNDAIGIPKSELSEKIKETAAEVAEGLKNKTAEISEMAIDAIKEPVQNKIREKINEAICPIN